VRSPPFAFVDSTVSPIFLLTTALMKPRTLWACQRVASISAASVAPPGCCKRARIVSVLLPSRVAFAAEGFLGALAAFFPWLAFLLALGFDEPTDARRGATRAFLLRFGVGPSAVAWASPFSSVIEVVMVSPSAAITAVGTWITPICSGSKAIVQKIEDGERLAMMVEMLKRLQMFPNVLQ